MPWFEQVASQRNDVPVIIDRVFTPGLAQVAYLIADEASGDVAVIDPAPGCRRLHCLGR